MASPKINIFRFAKQKAIYNTIEKTGLPKDLCNDIYSYISSENIHISKKESLEELNKIMKRFSEKNKWMHDWDDKDGPDTNTRPILKYPPSCAYNRSDIIFDEKNPWYPSSLVIFEKIIKTRKLSSAMKHNIFMIASMLTNINGTWFSVKNRRAAEAVVLAHRFLTYNPNIKQDYGNGKDPYTFKINYIEHNDTLDEMGETDDEDIPDLENYFEDANSLNSSDEDLPY